MTSREQANALLRAEVGKTIKARKGSRTTVAPMGDGPTPQTPTANQIKAAEALRLFVTKGRTR